MNDRWHLGIDASSFYGSGVTTPLLEASNIIGLLKVLRDWTRNEDAMKHASKRKDEFLDLLARELRTPYRSFETSLRF